MHYNIYFDVKYKRIEDELCEKYKNQNEDDEENIKMEDIEGIIDQLYIHELSSVLSIPVDIDNFPPPECQDTLSMCWNLLKDQPNFLELMQKVKENNVTLNFGIGDDLEILFIIFFSFDLFHALHPCICERMHGKPISELSLQLLRESILEMK